MFYIDVTNELLFSQIYGSTSTINIKGIYYESELKKASQKNECASKDFKIEIEKKKQLNELNQKKLKQEMMLQMMFNQSMFQQMMNNNQINNS